jgi:polyisoprenoid-binding protein YceI
MKHLPFVIPAIIFTSFALLPPVAVANEFGVVLAEKSGITFVSKQMGAPSEGRFGKFSARITFDPAKPEQGRAQIDVDLTSIDAGSADANEEVNSKVWFNTREFPTARFVAPSLKPLGGGRYEATGKMTIKGKTRDVVAPFTAKIDGNTAVLEGSIPIQRLQYGIGDGVWADTSVVADEVQVRFRFTLSAIPALKK